MGQATDIVGKIMKNKNNYAKLGLIFPERPRKWKEFNLLVGENGSGKSRILQMIKKEAKEDCTVICLDFANDVNLTYDPKADLFDSEQNILSDSLIFGEEVKKEFFLDFYRVLNDQMLVIFNELLAFWNNENRRVKKQAEKILEELNPFIKDILHRELKVKRDGICLYKENYEVEVSNEWELLSPGERSILVTIFAILFIRLESRPTILLIDEMETHLHPDAQVKLYKLLKRTLPKSGDYCVCIASHSIFLLPLFEMRELVYMDGGKIGQINGGLYQQIYDNLTGEGDNKEDSLTDFLYSMSAWQYADYLAQCFLKPATVDEARSDDEQALKFVEVLKDLYSRKEMIEVLDFGAGSARIGRCLELMLKDNNEVLNLVSKLKYHIYDKYSISNEFKENTTWMGNAYRSEIYIASSGVKFDIILLYNVLHEIGIDEWVDEFIFLFDQLDKDGFLLFSEREILSVGEKPYGKSGYLVLGKQELSKLFPQSEINEIILPKKQNAVTVCFVIKKPKTREGYPNKEYVKSALKSLKDNTKSKIRNREKNGLGKRGKSRKYAFYCQQYVNVEEALEIMEEIGKKEIRQNLEDEGRRQWWNKNTTLTDILQANIPFKERRKKMMEIAREAPDTELGKDCQQYLSTH